MIESATYESLMQGVVLFFEAVGVAVIVGGFVLALYPAAAVVLSPRNAPR